MDTANSVAFIPSQGGGWVQGSVPSPTFEGEKTEIFFLLHELKESFINEKFHSFSIVLLLRSALSPK